jgi:hypothetical protein
MTVFQGAVDATFAAFGMDATYTPAGGDPRRPLDRHRRGHLPDGVASNGLSSQEGDA